MRRLLLVFILAAMPLLSHAIEEPEYEVIRKFDNVELRQYAPYVVAEVVLDTPAEDAGSQAFPILAGYIFGKNKGEKTFAMTAPVTQTAAPVRLDMTAPVTRSNSTFNDPSSVSLQALSQQLPRRLIEPVVPNSAFWGR